MGMREFVTASKPKSEEPAEIHFMVDGVEYHGFAPTQEQIIMLIAATTGNLSTSNEQVAAQINFFFQLLDAESHTLLARKLLDRDDQFDFDSVTAILEFLMEEAAENPTKSSSGSTSSPVSDGQNSTANAPGLASTPSEGSAQLVSAT